MKLRDYIRAARARWVGIVVLTLLVTGVAATYTFSRPKVYSASAGGLVEVTGGAQDASSRAGDDSMAHSRISAYALIATSIPVARRVQDELHLSRSPIRQITVDQPPDTLLLTVTADAESPAEAEALANAWIEAVAYRVQQIEGSGSGSSVSTAVVPIESAILPSSPSSPRPALNISLACALGLGLGMIYALLRFRFDRRIRTPAEIEERFGTPVLGLIPMDNRIDGIGTGARSATASDTSNWAAPEAFRKLRTNLAYMDVDRPPQVIVVTSPSKGDGKSTVASNLASAIALNGRPVTLVDGDLRRPTVAQSLGLIEGAGLTDVLVGRASLEEVLQMHVELEQLSVLAAGRVPPNPSELLGSKAMQALLGKLAARGIVIIDAPPLLPVTDSAVLSRNSDGAIMVVSHSKTLDNDLARALAQLETVNARVLGIVVNRVPRRDRRNGYYGGEYYSDVEASRNRGSAQTVQPASQPAATGATSATG